MIVELAIKLLLTAAIFFLVLPGVGVDGNTTVWLAVIYALLAYFVGDRLILPAAGNGVATVADAGLGFLTALWLPALFGYPIPWTSALWIAALSAVGEYFFHRYMISRRSGADRRVRNGE